MIRHAHGAVPNADASHRSAGTPRRVGIITLGLVMLIGGRLLGYVPTTASTTVVILAIATGMAITLPGLLRRWDGPWHVLVLGGFDIALVGLILTLHGPRGLSALLFLAVLPYAWDAQGRSVAWLAVGATAAYLASDLIHGWILAGSGNDSMMRGFLEAGLFLGLAMILVRTAGSLSRRLHRAGTVIERASQGDLGDRTEVSGVDRMGRLEAAVNRLLDGFAGTVAELRNGARDAGVLADVSVKTLDRVAGWGTTAAGTSTTLAGDLAQQRELVESEQQESARAAEKAAGLKASADQLSANARDLVEIAEQGRAQVARASETLVSIGEEVRTTAVRVHQLNGLSERVGAFAVAIGRIARQTRLLALNAAIEAARAEKEGEGFASVAEEVRTLANEAARSVHDVTDVITEVRAGIEATSIAIASGEERVRDVGEVAGEARRALETIRAGASEAATRVAQVATVSREQSDCLQALAEMLLQTAEISQRSRANADRAVELLTEQIETVSALAETSRELLELVDHLQAILSRWTVDPQPRS